jgi:hypothetical protein
MNDIRIIALYLLLWIIVGATMNLLEMVSRDLRIKRMIRHVGMTLIFALIFMLGVRVGVPMVPLAIIMAIGYIVVLWNNMQSNYCPTCRKFIDNPTIPQMTYCPKCGTKLA